MFALVWDRDKDQDLLFPIVLIRSRSVLVQCDYTITPDLACYEIKPMEMLSWIHLFTTIVGRTFKGFLWKLVEKIDL